MIGKRLTGSGFAPLQTTNLVGDGDLAVTALGATQTTAYAVIAANTLVTTTAASTGVILPSSSPGDEFYVANNGASALTVYPPVGGKVNAGTVNVGASLAATKSGAFRCLDPAGLNFQYVVSA